MESSWMVPLMVMVECLEAGSNTLSKVAMTEGMSDFVFVTYSNTLAFLFLLPSTLIYHRNRACPKISFPIVCRIFLLGILSCSLQMFMYIGINYSSAALASAMQCVSPAFTFLLAILTGMETINWRLQSSHAKLIGTVISIAGAYIVIFYQGPPIIFSSDQSSPNSLIHLSKSPSNWVIGGLLLATSSFTISLAYIVQTWIIKAYPAEMVVTLVGCIFVTILSTIVALAMERDPSAWKLSRGTELVSIAYSAIFLVMIRSVVYTWACRVKGPVFAGSFKPLGMAFAVLLGVIFLRDTLYIGSVIGAITITLGLYSVLRGKAKEVEIIEESGPSSFASASDNEAPLLKSVEA